MAVGLPAASAGVLLPLLGFLPSAAGCPRSEHARGLRRPGCCRRSATLEQVIQAVNQNTRADSDLREQLGHAERAELAHAAGQHRLPAAAGFPLAGRDGSLSGAEVDLGSNDQLFWYWVRRDQPPAVYFCRHEQFAASRARQAIPIDPYWLIEALGVVGFRPGTAARKGPFLRAAAGWRSARSARRPRDRPPRSRGSTRPPPG